MVILQNSLFAARHFAFCVSGNAGASKVDRNLEGVKVRRTNTVGSSNKMKKDE